MKNIKFIAIVDYTIIYCISVCLVTNRFFPLNCIEINVKCYKIVNLNEKMKKFLSKHVKDVGNGDECLLKYLFFTHCGLQKRSDIRQREFHKKERKTSKTKCLR